MKRKPSSDQERRVEALYGMLRERRAEAESRLRSLREDMPSQDMGVKDAEEQSVEDFVRDMDVALIVMESENLRRIDEALLRLEAGTYGVCAECEGTIAEARLQALPFAVLCRGCQELQEQDGVGPVGTRRPAFEEPSKHDQALVRQRAALQSDPAIRKTARLARNLA
jgi:DnaK suppressor protein